MTQALLENGISLEYEIEGNVQNPCLLIILGITDNITDWPEGLYQPLVDAGYCVIRYELRDMGWSTHLEQAGEVDLATAAKGLAEGKLPNAPYSIHDMAEDAGLLLSHLNIKKVCVVGYSYGAAVAQRLALDVPETVAGLVCLQGSNYNPALPLRTSEVEQAMFKALINYDTLSERVQAIANLRKATNGSIHFLEDEEALESATKSVERMYYPQGTARIVLSRLATKPFFAETKNITCPTLVLHGDADPIFSIAHGEDICNHIPNAELIVLQGAGHNHPLSLQPMITENLINFMQRI